MIFFTSSIERSVIFATLSDIEFAAIPKQARKISSEVDSFEKILESFSFGYSDFIVDSPSSRKVQFLENNF